MRSSSTLASFLFRIMFCFCTVRPAFFSRNDVSHLYIRKLELFVTASRVTPKENQTLLHLWTHVTCATEGLIWNRNAVHCSKSPKIGECTKGMFSQGALYLLLTRSVFECSRPRGHLNISDGAPVIFFLWLIKRELRFTEVYNRRFSPYIARICYLPSRK